MSGDLRGQLLTLVGILAGCYLTYRASVRATGVQRQAAVTAAQMADESRAKRMRDDLTVAEEEVTKLRRQVAVLTREAEAAVADLVYLRRTIWRQGMTIERLREFVGPESPPPANGRNP